MYTASRRAGAPEGRRIQVRLRAGARTEQATVLATSSCLYAGFGGELQLAVRNYSTCMSYHGELELLKAGAAKCGYEQELVPNIQLKNKTNK